MEPGGDLTKGKDQLRLFSEFEQEITDRDLIIFIFDGKIIRDSTLKKIAFDVQSIPNKDFQGVLLIGKDGGVKFKEKFLVDPAIVFELIDSMPMRQREIKIKNIP